MKARYRLYRPSNGNYYCQDNVTDKQESLGTKIKLQAQRLINARNEAQVAPSINIQIAQAYITADEQARIVEREGNPERRRYYQLLWEVGASQSDMANLCAEDIDWEHRTISFDRMKLRGNDQKPAILHFGPSAAKILREMPQQGPLFPDLRTVPAKHRTTEFKQRCRGLKTEGVCLHSYRYAWAERAQRAGMPERFAQKMLGPNSKAVHRVYAKRALVEIPSLEEYDAKAESERRDRQESLSPGRHLMWQSCSLFVTNFH